MGRARVLGETKDPLTNRQLSEVVRAVNSVTIRPAEGDVGEDGTARHDSAPEQMEGRHIQFVSKGPGVEVEVSHSLGRVPFGFLETALSYPALTLGFPNRPQLNRSWTKNKVYLVPQSPAGTEHRALLL